MFDCGFILCSQEGLHKDINKILQVNIDIKLLLFPKNNNF